ASYSFVEFHLTLLLSLQWVRSIDGCGRTCPERPGFVCNRVRGGAAGQVGWFPNVAERSDAWLVPPSGFPGRVDAQQLYPEPVKGSSSSSIGERSRGRQRLYG